MVKVIGRKVNLRGVVTIDAKFIVDLRSSKGRFLSQSSSLLSDQISWIDNYLCRFERGEEFYFVIEDKKGYKLGVVRIYDTNQGKDSFCWGSWLIRDGAPFYTSIESALLVYEFAFDVLKKNKAKFDVRKDNANVVRFHESFGAKRIGEDDKNFYYELTPSIFSKSKERFKKYLKND